MDVDKSLLEQYDIDINEWIPKITDSIVEIYKEKHRELIKERLQTMVINTYVTYEDVKNEYNQQKSQVQNQLAIKFLKAFGVEILPQTEEEVYQEGNANFTEEQKEILKLFFETNTFRRELGPIFDFEEDALKDANKWVKKEIMTNRCKILKKYGLAITPENYDTVISSPKGKEVMQQVQKIYAIVQKLKEEQIKWEESHIKEAEYIEAGKTLKQELDFQYLKRFYSGILPYVPEEQQQTIQKALRETDKWSFLQVADKEELYTHYGEWDTSILGTFQEKYDSIVYNQDYSAEQVRKKRIKYFKIKGLDLGEDYSFYEKSEEALALWPDKDLLKKIAKIEKQCETEKEKEFFLRTSNYRECKERLEKLKLCLEDDFSIDFVKNKVTCVCPNVIQDKQGKYKNVNVIHLPILGMLNGYKDIIVIHEILHIVELTLKQTSASKFHFKIGLDECIEELNTKQNEHKEDTPYENQILREYEILSENLHQNIAIAVVHNLHKKGIYLFDNPKTAKITGGSSYEQVNVITAGIIQNFPKEIIDAMILPDANVLYTAIGKQNLKKLNEVVKEYRQLPYYEMMMDVIYKKDTPLVRKRNDLIHAARKITEQMTLHSQNQYTIPIAKIKSVADLQGATKKMQAYQAIKKDVQKAKEGEVTVDE